jgi:fructokinase
MRLVVAGENIVDLVPVEGTDTYRALPGGSPATIAIAARRLGVPTSLLARFGNDVFAQRVRERLTADGVDLTYAVDAAAPTALAAVSFDAERRASYDFWLSGAADWGWRDDELPAQLPDGVAALHVGSLATYLEPGAATLLRLAARVRDRVTVTFDPNIRPAVVHDLDTARARTRELAALATVVKASDEDLAHLYPDVGWRAAALDLLAQGPELVVVTLGGEGAVGLRNGSELAAPAPAVPVIDTVGAGDTVMGALLVGLLEAGLLTADGGRLREAPDAVVARALQRAVQAAALTCTREGADPPTTGELLSAFPEQDQTGTRTHDPKG